jgi:hypothetical protein
MRAVKWACVALSSSVVLLSSCAPAGEGEGEEAGEGEGEQAGVGEGEGEGEGDACAGADAVLGTALLGAGFSIVDSAASPLPAGTFLALAAVDDGAGNAEVLVLHADVTVERVGVWPNLAVTDAIPTSLAPPDFDANNDFASYYLVADRDALVAGVTRADFSGTLAIHDRAGGTTSFLDAPGNFHAALVGGRLLVDGLGLDALTSDGARVYGVADLAAPAAVQVVDFGGAPFSSFVLPLAAGGALLGATDPTTFSNDFYGVSSEALDGAFASPAVAPVVGTPLVSIPALLGATPLSDGVAFVAVDDVTTFSPSALRFLSVADDGGGGGAGALVDALTLTDACTSLGAVTAFPDGSALVVLDHATGDDVIVRIAHTGT